MEGKSPCTNSLNITEPQESQQFHSVLSEWAKCLEGVDGENSVEEELAWKRVRWTDEMAKLLITAVSYVDDDRNEIRSSLHLHKIGKWKVISMALIQRGFQVSPQQCEDKFNDLNKRYKRLNVLLGNGMSCKVVENPNLVHMLNLSSDVKEEVSRILSSKQLLYEQLCSYHHNNNLFLPHDRKLQRQLIMFAKGESGSQCNGELEAAEQEDHSSEGKSSKKAKMDSQLSNGNVKGKSVLALIEEGIVGHEREMSRLRQLEKQKLELEKKKFELEKEKIKLMMVNQRADWKLEKFRLENEQLKLENARLAFELEWPRTEE